MDLCSGSKNTEIRELEMQAQKLNKKSGNTLN